MNCPRCGKQIPNQAAFCMHCGNLVSQPSNAMQAAMPQGMHTQGMPAPAMPMPMPMGQQRKPAIMGVIVGIVLLAAIVFGLNAAGVLKLGGQSAQDKALQAQGSQSNLDSLRADGSQPDLNALQANGSTPNSNALRADGSNNVPSVLQAEGTQGGPILPATAERKTMPDDVRRWLEHLERIEKKRVDMTQDQLAAAIMQMTELQLGGSMSDLQKLLDDTDDGGTTTQENIDTAKEAVNTFEGNRRKWNALNDEFLSVPAPAECVPLRNEYDKVLRETGSMILEIVKSVEDADTDRQAALKKLMKMQGTSDARIGKPARGSDRMLGEICSKYDTTKWFSITSDVGSGMMGKIGF